MAIRYQVVMRPTDGVRIAREIVDVNGTHAKEAVVANAVGIPSGNYLSVLQSLVNKAVQPSSAQLAGLLGYIAAIEAGTNTGAVETAISGL